MTNNYAPWYKQTTNPTKRKVRRTITWIVNLAAIAYLVWFIILYPWWALYGTLAVVGFNVFFVGGNWLFDNDGYKPPKGRGRGPGD